VETIVKQNGRLEKDLKVKTINRSGLKRGLKKYHKKLHDLVMDMHFKVAKQLVDRYDEIYIGKLSTKSILSRNNKAINKQNKRMIGVLSPYTFRQRLKYMGNKYGSKVTEINEYKTTKT